MEEEVKEDVVATDEVKEQPEELENVSSEEGEDATGEAQGDDSEPKKPPVEVEKESITFDEFEKDFSERKTGAQKRIDKLTAKNYQYEEQINQLRSELEALKAGKAPDMDNIQDKPKYTEDQLKRAYEKAVLDGDTNLQWEVQQELAKMKVWEAEQRYLKQHKQQAKEQQEEAEVYAGIVEQYKFETDPDMNLRDPNSLLCKVAGKLLQDERSKAYYTKLGSARLAAAISDARAYIYELRMKKKSLSTTKNLEKTLQKEKLKTSLGAKSSGSSQRPHKKEVESGGEREDAFKKLFGI